MSKIITLQDKNENNLYPKTVVSAIDQSGVWNNVYSKESIIINDDDNKSSITASKITEDRELSLPNTSGQFVVGYDSDKYYGSELPTDGEQGQVFFKTTETLDEDENGGDSNLGKTFIPYISGQDGASGAWCRIGDIVFGYAIITKTTTSWNILNSGPIPKGAQPTTVGVVGENDSIQHLVWVNEQGCIQIRVSSAFSQTYRVAFSYIAQ